MRKLGTNAHREFQSADDVWSSELRRVFGRRAGDVRYTAAGHGAPRTALRRAHDERERARNAWDKESQE